MRDGTNTMAMGRIIGDGGCFCQVVDMAVLPSYQGQGLGAPIMAALMDHLLPFGTARQGTSQVLSRATIILSL